MFLHHAFYDSPLGWIKISGNGAISSVVFQDHDPKLAEFQLELPQYLQDAVQQLREYFHRERDSFDLPLAPNGTTFQKNVWKHLQQIEFGKTSSYLNLAERLGDRKTIRAVGQASARNPIAILIPCHRLIGSDGDLTGFAWGLDRKKALLALENPMSFGEQGALF